MAQGNPPYPSSNPATGVVSVVTSAAANSLVIKPTGPANMFSVYASSLAGGTTGFLMLFNSPTVPADGAVSGCASPATSGCLVDCAPFTSGAAQVANQGLPPSVYSFGLVAVISSGSTCGSKVTGTLTAFIVAKAL